jgi:integrase
MPVENRGTARRPKWRYAFTIRGVRYRAAIPEARTKFEAEQAELEAKKAVFEGRYGRPTGEIGFAEFVGNPDAENEQFVEGSYLAWAKESKRSWRHDVFRARVLLKHFRGKTLAQVSPLLIEKFKSERRKSITARGGTRSPASVNRELELLSRIFTVAMKQKLVDKNPCREVQLLPLDNKRTRYLTDEEEPLLLAQLTGTRAHLMAPVLLALGTGMRRGDLFNLRWSQVDFQAGIVYVPNAKTGRGYPVPMSKQVRTVLLELHAKTKGAELVFTSGRTGGAYHDLKKGFTAACSDAGLAHLRWHDLRHTFGTRLAEAGVSEAVIAELMGHTDPKTTRRYTHGTERGKREAVEAALNVERNSCPISAPNAKQPPKLVAVNG